MPSSLASSIVSDFGNGLNMLDKFSELPRSIYQCNLKYVKINMVEGSMFHDGTLPFSGRSLSKYMNTAFPNLRIISTDPWSRTDTKNATAVNVAN